MRALPGGALRTQRDVARALGITRSTLQWVERCALNKLRIAAGLAPRRAMTGQDHPRRFNCCGRCGEPGHHRTTCAA